MKNRIKSIGWAISIAWKVDKWIMIVWFSLIAVVSILPSVALYYNRDIINSLSKFISNGEGSFEKLLPVIITFGVVTALIGLSNRLNVELIYSVMYNKYYFGMSELLMDSVQKFSMEELLKKDVNDEYYAVILREGSLTDIISGLCTLFGKFIGLASLLIVAVGLSIPVFIFSIIYIICMIWVNLVYVEKRRTNYENLRDNERLAGHYEQMPYSTEYAKEIRTFDTRSVLKEKWEEAYKHIFDFQIKDIFNMEIRTLVSGLGFYVFLMGMIILSLFSVMNGKMDAASLLVIFTLCLNIFTSVSGVARMIMITDHGIHAIERQYRIFGLHKDVKGKKEVNANVDETNNVVFETKHLSYAYGGDKLALDDVSIKINKGETIALVGANGSGKSTLVKLLLQLYKPKSGDIYFYGTNYEKLEDGFLKNKIGAFFQDYYLFHMPIEENIGFGDIDNVNDEHKIDNALKKGGALSFVNKLPNKKATFVGKNIEKSGAVFSGGERQKLAISRTHMSDKEILIFDEPASALDPIAELEQFKNIKEKSNGRTAILISHRVGFARLADKIILLDKGKVAEFGTHDELMAKNGLYTEFFNAQSQWYRNTEVIGND